MSSGRAPDASENRHQHNPNFLDQTDVSKRTKLRCNVVCIPPLSPTPHTCAKKKKRSRRVRRTTVTLTGFFPPGFCSLRKAPQKVKNRPMNKAWFLIQRCGISHSKTSETTQKSFRDSRMTRSPFAILHPYIKQLGTFQTAW